MKRYQKLMIAHGFLVMAVGLIAGFMLLFALIGGFEFWPGRIAEFSVYGTVEGWVRAHSGGITNGMMVVIVALALPYLKLSEAMNKFFAWGLIYVAWSFTLFYWIGNASGNRSLTFGDSPLGGADWLSILGFLPGVPSIFIAPIILFIGARAALRLIAKNEEISTGDKVVTGQEIAKDES
ncbi:MAG TPA: isomerase [Gammaproteobacteria bacterium]|nr:isomerase [Gammaproteobacteria bacterium]|tara:strand:- start:7424 stop:7963 length:540 start_codon:yes stop_codon:yes gene_type:complete